MDIFLIMSRYYSYTGCGGYRSSGVSTRDSEITRNNKIAKYG